jgi:hypothetical protein
MPEEAPIVQGRTEETLCIQFWAILIPQTGIGERNRAEDLNPSAILRLPIRGLQRVSIRTLMWENVKI